MVTISLFFSHLVPHCADRLVILAKDADVWAVSLYPFSVNEFDDLHLFILSMSSMTK